MREKREKNKVYILDFGSIIREVSFSYLPVYTGNLTFEPQQNGKYRFHNHPEVV